MSAGWTSVWPLAPPAPINEVRYRIRALTSNEIPALILRSTTLHGDTQPFTSWHDRVPHQAETAQIYMVSQLASIDATTT
jgi:hypothetical protein